MTENDEQDYFGKQKQTVKAPRPEDLFIEHSNL